MVLLKIQVAASILELARTHLEIKNTTTQVHFDMETAYNRYLSLQKQVESYK